MLILGEFFKGIFMKKMIIICGLMSLRSFGMVYDVPSVFAVVDPNAEKAAYEKKMMKFKTFKDSLTVPNLKDVAPEKIAETLKNLSTIVLVECAKKSEQHDKVIQSEIKERAARQNQSFIDRDNEIKRKVAERYHSKPESARFYENNIIIRTTVRALLLGSFEGFSTLVKLTIDDVGLAYISPGVFKNLKNLRRLSLSGNLLENIEPGTFEGQENLFELSLYNNVLTSFTPEAAEGLTNLKWLRLANNNIEELSLETLEKMPRLTFLQKSGNRLSEENKQELKKEMDRRSIVRR